MKAKPKKKSIQKKKFKQKTAVQKPKKPVQQKQIARSQGQLSERKTIDIQRPAIPRPVTPKRVFLGDLFEAEERELPQIQKEPAKLTEPQIDELRQMLLDERKKILDRLSQHVSEAVDDVVPEADELDQAGTSSNQAYLLRLADKEQKLLKEIDNALRKFETGDYGYCEGTGELIGYERLKIRPWTKYSIKHKEMLEHKEGKRRKTIDI